MRWVCGAVVWALLAFGAPAAQAEPSGAERTFACAAKASEITGLPVLLIWAVKKVESGGSLGNRVLNQNENGSVDRGLMQINSIWEPWAAEHGLRPDQLHDPCVSLLLGSVILANEVRAHGVAEGVGRYHVGNPEGRKTPALRAWARARHTWYVTRVTEELQKLQQGLARLQGRRNG